MNRKLNKGNNETCKSNKDLNRSSNSQNYNNNKDLIVIKLNKIITNKRMDNKTNNKTLKIERIFKMDETRTILI